MGPWPNSNEIQGSPSYSLKDLPKLAAKKLLTNYKPNNVIVSHITITQKIPISKLTKKIDTSNTLAASNNNNGIAKKRKTSVPPPIKEAFPILSSLLSKDTLKTFFDFKLAPTTCDLDLDKFPIANLDEESSSSYERKFKIEPKLCQSVIPEIVKNAKPEPLVTEETYQKCDKCCKSLKNLKRHQTYFCQKPKCEKCLKYFVSKKQLKKHQTHFCPHFLQSDTQKQPEVSALDVGNNQDHPESFPVTVSMFPKVNCEKCFKTFLNQQQLKKHQISYCSQPKSDNLPLMIDEKTEILENRKTDPNPKVKSEKCSKVVLSNQDLEKHQPHFCQEVTNADSDDLKEVIDKVPEIMNDSDAMNTNLNPEPIDLSLPTKFKCEKCYKMFTSEEESYKHSIYYCQTVYVSEIVNNRDLEALNNTNLNPEPMDLSIVPLFKCNKCVKTFSSNSHLKNHQIYYCPHFSKSESDEKLVIDEPEISKDTNNQEPIFKVPFFKKCEKCFKTFMSKLSMEKHHCPLQFQNSTEKLQNSTEKSPNVPEIVKNSTDTEEPLNQKKCERCFKTPKDLKKHQNYCQQKSKNLNEKTYNCKSCQKSFPTAFAYTIHKRSEHEDSNQGPIKCQMCEREFAKLTDLTSHLQSEHKVESPLFKCTFCDEKFAWKSQLKRHRASKHVIQEPQACKVCKKLRCKHKGTWRNPNLAGNSNKTKGNKDTEPRKEKKLVKPGKKKAGEFKKPEEEMAQMQYKCEECNFIFTNLGSFRDHKKRIHVTENLKKPHQCDRCHKQFSKEQALKIHKQIFHDSPIINSVPDKKRFPCTICQRKFSSQQYLKKHISSHVMSSMSI